MVEPNLSNTKKYVKAHQINYYAALIAVGCAVVLGGIATWLTF